MKNILKVFVLGVALLGLAGSVGAQSYDELEKVVASDGIPDDRFGRSISISGNRAIVGASDANAAYIYEWNGASWAQTAKLTTAGSSQFGFVVAISGDRIVVGEYTEAVYIYEWDGNSWVETKIVASDGEAGDSFGRSVAISGERVLVGSYLADGTGAAYIYDRNGGAWDETKILASDGEADDYFGHSVSISGERIIVGAIYDGGFAGSVYIYDRNGGAWDQETKLTAGDAAGGDYFGYSVSVSGDRAIVGAYGNDDAGSSTGAAYIYDRNGGTWDETKILASDGDANDVFGRSVSISGDTAIAGAYGNSDAGARSGSAYIYEWNGVDTWVETKIVATDAEANDFFGVSVSISDGTAIVGAYQEGTMGTNAGAAYFFGSLVVPDNFCSSGDISGLSNPVADTIYWDWDSGNPYLANNGGTAVVLIIAPAETVKATTAELPAAGTAEPGLVYFDEQTGELYIADASGDLQDPATITSNAVSDTAAVEASAVAGEVYFDTTSGEVFFCEVDGTLDNPADPSSSCLTQE